MKVFRHCDDECNEIKCREIVLLPQISIRNFFYNFLMVMMNQIAIRIRMKLKTNCIKDKKKCVKGSDLIEIEKQEDF